MFMVQMKTDTQISREIKTALARIEREFEGSEAKKGWKLRAVPKLPDMVRIELIGRNVTKQRDIYPHQIAHVHKTLACQ